MRARQAFFWAVPAALFALAGCGGRGVFPKSPFDQAQMHVNQGMRELEAGRLAEARAEFERAIGLEDAFAPGYVGLALVEMEGRRFKEAKKLAKKAKKKDKKLPDVYVAMARIRMAEGRDGWYGKALEDLDDAKKYGPDDPMVYYYKGRIHEGAFQLDSAATAFAKVIDLKAAYTADANAEWEKIQKVERAAPGTEIGVKIGLVEEITRAELAVLFIEELKLPEVLERDRKAEYDTKFQTPERHEARKKMNERASGGGGIPPDAAGHWARNWIRDILSEDLRGLELYPDGTFRPDAKASRAEFALLAEDVLTHAFHDPDLPTRFIGEESEYPDVPGDHFAYNAIRVCVNKGIMKADLKDNHFGPAETVAGADALLMIQTLRNVLRQTF